MLSIFSAGGVWNIIITILGVGALVTAVAQFKYAGQRSYVALIIGLVASIPCTAFLAYGLGLWSAASMVNLEQSPQTVQLMAVAEAYAATALAWGGLMGLLSTVMGTVAIHRHVRAVETHI